MITAVIMLDTLDTLYNQFSGCFGHDVVLSAAMDIDTAARRLAELGNPTRLQIVRALVQAGGEGLPIGELQTHLDVPASTLAFHLRGLVTAGLVTQRKEGRVVRCTPNLKTINETLAFVKEHCCAGLGNRIEPSAATAAAATPTRVRRAAGR